VPGTIPAILNFDETFDVGTDTRSSVDEKDYLTPFSFNGTINKLTVQLGKK
jgi:arylsulfatase